MNCCSSRSLLLAASFAVLLLLPCRPARAAEEATSPAATVPAPAPSAHQPESTATKFFRALGFGSSATPAPSPAPAVQPGEDHSAPAQIEAKPPMVLTPAPATPKSRIVEERTSTPPPLSTPPAVPSPAPAPEPPAPPTAEAANQALAEAIRKDLLEVDDATKAWAKAKRKMPKAQVTLREIRPYLPADSPVVTTGGNDREGNPINLGTVESGPHVSSKTAKALGLPDSFWGDYAPLLTKREVADMTLADLKRLRLAILTWDADLPADAPGRTQPLTFEMLKGYLPVDSELWQMGGEDRVGNAFVLGTAKDPVRISSATFTTLGMSRDYWGEFSPKANTASSSRPGTRRSAEPPPRTFGRKVKNFFKGL